MVLEARSGDGTVGEFLDRLAARSPTPASGSVAALCVAQAAALVVMVARFCDAQRVVERAERLVEQAHRLAGEDERAFRTVAEAWALPRATSSEEHARRSAIDEALLGSAEPQVRVVETAIEVLVLTDQLRPAARAGLLADLAAAGEVARAGSAIARTNVESNLQGLPASDERSELHRRIGVAKEMT